MVTYYLIKAVYLFKLITDKFVIIDGGRWGFEVRLLSRIVTKYSLSPFDKNRDSTISEMAIPMT